MKTCLQTLLFVGALWLCANLIHTLWIGLRRWRWERRLQRNAEGLLSDAAPYSCGEGTTAILMVHGFADSPAVFSNMARLLAGAGIHCRVMRLPGAGERLCHASRQSLERLLAALMSELAALRTTHQCVWLAGHSMGGALALASQLEHPATADGLILLAPMIEVSPARAPLLSPASWFRIAEIAFPLSQQFESAFAPQVLTRDGSTTLYTRDRFIPFATYRILFKLTRMLRGRQADIKAPAFVALASDDRIVDTPAAQHWFDTSNATPLQLELLPESGHAIPLETNLLPELCRKIVAFISRSE